MKIESGTGNGKWARVSERNRLFVNSKSAPIQHIAAIEDQSTFQVIGTATCANGTVTPLTIKNTGTETEIVLTYIRWQILDPTGGSPIPNASNYLQIGYDAEFSSGGSVATPVNMTAGSSQTSNATCYGTNPTLTGSLTVFDRHYPKAEGDMYSFNKEGAAILKPGQSISFQYVGDHTAGTVYVRCSFYTEPLGGDR